MNQELSDPIPFEKRTELSLPLYLSRIEAGFPSPADDYVEQKLDLNEFLVSNPAATFFLRVKGNSMKGAGIHSGDLLIVDRALEPEDGSIIIAVMDGELTVKRLRHQSNDIQLISENEDYTPISARKYQDFEIWGVVTNVIHSFS